MILKVQPCKRYTEYNSQNSILEPQNRIRLNINPTAKCCEQRGVPDKCMYACGVESSVETIDNSLCNDYVDVIDKCKSKNFR